jgi:hypothetical protein
LLRPFPTALYCTFSLTRLHFLDTCPPTFQNGQVTPNYTQPLLSALRTHIITVYF